MSACIAAEVISHTVAKRPFAWLQIQRVRLTRRDAYIEQRVTKCLMTSFNRNARRYLVEVPCVDASRLWNRTWSGEDFRRAIEAFWIQKSLNRALDSLVIVARHDAAKPLMTQRCEVPIGILPPAKGTLAWPDLSRHSEVVRAPENENDSQ